MRGGPEPLPPTAPRQEILAALRKRADQFRTVYDTNISLTIQVKTEKGMETLPKLGGILAFDSRLPGLWLHCEKLTRKIFGLRATGDRFSLELMETRELVTGGPAAYSKLPHLVRPWEVMAWFGSPEWLGLSADSAMEVEENDYRFDVSLSGMLIRCVFVDRRAVAISRIVDYDLLGNVRTEVLMDRYKKADGIDFARRLTVERPQHGCRVQLRLRSPKFNKDLQRKMFEPKKGRTGWSPVDLDREPLSSVRAFRAER